MVKLSDRVSLQPCFWLSLDAERSAGSNPTTKQPPQRLFRVKRRLALPNRPAAWS